MTDDQMGRQWLIQKRTLQEYEDERMDLANRTYKANNNDNNESTSLHQLDIISAIGLVAVLEMEDGRDFRCLRPYYKQWKTEVPFSGEPFFDWMDYGSGKKAVTDLCSRKKLNAIRYGMLKAQTVESSVVEFRRRTVRRTLDHRADSEDINNRNKKNTSNTITETMVQAVFVETQQPVQGGSWLSIWDLQERLHLIRGGYFMAQHQPQQQPKFFLWKQGHGSVTHGRPVLYAGEMNIGDAGRVQYTIPKSGHYRPQKEHTRALYQWLRRQVGGEVARTAIDWKPLQTSPSKATLQAWKAFLFD